MNTTRLPLELLSLVVTSALGEHLPALIQDTQRPTWDALLVLTRTSPALHDLALTSLTRSLGTRWPSRRSFAPTAPFLATSLPKDVRRRLRFMRRVCAGNAVDTRAASIESLSRFVLDNRDANSPFAKACICLVTARAMIARRLYSKAFDSLARCLRFCAQVRPVELADALRNRAVRLREDLGLALHLDTIGRDITGGFFLPRDQVIVTLTRCLDTLEQCKGLKGWQLNLAGLPRLLTMMCEDATYSPMRMLRRRAGTMLLQWKMTAEST